MKQGHKDWRLTFEATPEDAKKIEKYIYSMADIWQIDLQENV